MELAGLIVGCFAIGLTAYLYYKNRKYTNERFESIEGLAKSANRKAGQAGKASGAHKGHKERKKK